MKDIDLTGSHVLVLGKKNTGKSYFTNYLMSISNGPYLSFDPMREHEDYGRDDIVIRPDATRGDDAVQALDDAINFLEENRDTFEWCFVDECNRFHTKGGTLDGAIGALADYNAHYGMGMCMVARRPVQVHTDLRELADWLFVFRLTGQNDVRTLDNISRGLGERAASLNPREFMVVAPSGEYWRHDPIQAKLHHEKGV